MIMASPQICLRSVNELELRYEYIYFHMGIESREFPECACWIDLELEEIMMRHKFLKKTGQYILPDPKRPQFKMVYYKLNFDKEFYLGKSKNVSNFRHRRS